jgi:aminoglycoside 2'-N-acetyltransferase I
VSIEIEIVSGDGGWPRAEKLLDAVWPPAEMAKLSWGHVKWAHADLRVLIETDDGVLACHAGIYFRTVTWNGQKVHIGGLGGVATRIDCRRRGYASIALDAAVHTMRDHDVAQFALLFCEPHNFEFYRSRGWQPFTGAVYAEQPEGRIRFDVMTPFVLDLKRRAPTLGTLDLCGLPW